MTISPYNKFKKDIKRIKSRGYNIKKIKSVIDLLLENKKLEEKYRDHNLIGKYETFRECHIEPDWLLIYKIDIENDKLILFRTGTHADLF